MSELAIRIFSTCPQSENIDKKDYLNRLRDVSQWSEDCGCEGILVYADNRQPDPWLISSEIIGSTEKLSPLVAVQPVYMHPFTVAKIVATIGYMYNRKIYLNMVAGGFKNDLKALDDQTPHNQRYERLAEYSTIISELLKDEAPVTFKGRYYNVNNLKLNIPLDKDLFPGIFVSGSSDAGFKAAGDLKATAIQYPQSANEYDKKLDIDSQDYGIRIGIIARNEGIEAWQTAVNRFPENRAGQLAHKLAIKTTDSVWYKNLAGSNATNSAFLKENGNASVPDSPYWLHPFKTYSTMCPYLVGSYETVARELSKYIEIGYKTFILDIPPNKEELIHIQEVFQMAKKEIVA